MIQCANPSEQFKSYQSEIEAAVLNVMRSNSYVLGNEVSKLEEEFANYIGTEFSIGVANGTDAIEISLRALEIGCGDEVITVSHTAVATVAAIEATGAKAVLVDIEPKFYTLNPDQLSEVLSKRTKAVIAVHLYGQPADIDSISNFCNENNLFFIEDTSQAHGAKYKGKRLGSIGHFGCFSCYPTKNLGAIGDAGLITTNDYNLQKRVRMLREYGWSNRVSKFPGRNSRLDEIQATILRIKLKYLEHDNARRAKLAHYYNEQLSDLDIQLPTIRIQCESVYHLFVIQVHNRDEFVQGLKKENIYLGIHYPVPVHLQPAYKNRILKSNDLNVTEALVNKIVSLPIYPELGENNARKVVSAIEYFQNN